MHRVRRQGYRSEEIAGNPFPLQSRAAVPGLWPKNANSKQTQSTGSTGNQSKVAARGYAPIAELSLMSPLSLLSAVREQRQSFTLSP